MRFFRNIPADEVTQAIFEMSAEGGDFAPNLGQIYAKIKGQRKALKPVKVDEGYYTNCKAYAATIGVEPPQPTDDLIIWFEGVRDAAASVL
jgi:hypothetical protein